MSAPLPQESNVEPYWFSKDKLPKRLSYPLKRSLLDEALHNNGIFDAVYSVRYLGHPNRETVLDASFNPIGRVDQHPRVGGRSLLTLWAVPSERRHEMETIIVEQAIPILCKWLAKTQNEGDAWRALRHEITFEVRDGKLHCGEDK